MPLACCNDGDKIKQMVLPVSEFLRRFEQHILPKGFGKIRSYGCLKNHNKHAQLNALRQKMNLPPAPPKVRITVQQRMLEKYRTDISRCPKCEKGTMMLMETLRPYYDRRIKQWFSNGKERSKSFALIEGCEVGVAAYFFFKLLQYKL
ncbi:transposase [Chryseolinea sp. H1M3-3]|uniref:transposase n=1 Tax=Chryseolinea sp. H1M3-3 TaxID=3034144 RepID=UPI0023EE0D8B|nr:transposase [Chryseolinea sp. H1M3-3]